MVRAVEAMEFNPVNYFKNDDEVMWMFEQLGADTRSFRREETRVPQDGYRDVVTTKG